MLLAHKNKSNKDKNKYFPLTLGISNWEITLSTQEEVKNFVR